MTLLWLNFTKFAGKFLYTRKALVFVNGFLVASLLYFYTEDSYEKKIFAALASYVENQAPNSVNNKQEALLLNCLHLTHHLGENRASIFSGKDVSSFKSTFIHPVTYDLMTTNGACGSYAYILSRLLNELNIPNRIAQMKVNGEYGGHILVEAQTSRGWVTLDASFDLYFRKANGALASFNDVQNNWNYYRSQVPANYDMRYKYDGVRYTNWNRIPVLMPAVKSIIELAIGREATRYFSLRTFFLRKFHVLFDVTLFICLVIFVVIIRSFLRSNPELVKKHFPFIQSKKRSILVITPDVVIRRA